MLIWGGYNMKLSIVKYDIFIAKYYKSFMIYKRFSFQREITVLIKLKINWQPSLFLFVYFLRKMSFFHIARWRFMWRERWSDLENARSHKRHWKGRSPVCFLVCRVSSSDRANLHPQPLKLHMYGFSPVCVLWWALRWLDLVYVLLQPGWGQVWMTCFLFDHARRFLGFPDLVNDAGLAAFNDFCKALADSAGLWSVALKLPRAAIWEWWWW